MPRATIDIDMLVTPDQVSRAGLVALKRLRGSGQDHDDIKRLTGETE